MTCFVYINEFSSSQFLRINDQSFQILCKLIKSGYTNNKVSETNHLNYILLFINTTGVATINLTDILLLYID